MQKECKRALMGLAALLILIFHFYVPFTKGSVEMTVVKAAYIGVDLFFFLSAVSMTNGKKMDYPAFLKNRIINVYLIFVAFTVIAALYRGWDILRLVRIVSGVELFTKGGGAFLWYVPAIMIMYILCPIFLWAKEKLGKYFPVSMMVVWFVVVMLLEKIAGYTTVFILLNRLPVYFAGMCYPQIRAWAKDRKPVLIIVAGLVIGGYFLYKFAGIRRLNTPVQDVYYVMAMPFVVSLAGLADFLTSNHEWKMRFLGFLGGMTLEIYGLQMIFGFNLETWLIKMMGNGQLAFLITLTVLILMSYVFYRAKMVIMNLAKETNSMKGNV